MVLLGLVGSVPGQVLVRLVPAAREGRVVCVVGTPESLNGGKGRDLCGVVGLEIVVVVVGREAAHSAAGGGSRFGRGTRGEVGTLGGCGCVIVCVARSCCRGGVQGGALGGRGTKELREIFDRKALVDAIGGRGGGHHGGGRIDHRRVRVRDRVVRGSTGFLRV